MDPGRFCRENETRCGSRTVLAARVIEKREIKSERERDKDVKIIKLGKPFLVYTELPFFMEN